MELHKVEGNRDAKRLYDLGGIAPDATGDESSVDFIRGIRDEWT